MTGESEANFDFACGKYKGRVDDAEGLREEGEVCADERELVFGILDGVALARLRLWGGFNVSLCRRELEAEDGSVLT